MSDDMEGYATASEKARITTEALFELLDDNAEGSPERAIIFGNSAIAAAMMLFHKHAVMNEDYRPLFQLFWSPIIFNFTP